MYRPADHPASHKLPLMLYIHGGAYITGIPENANDSIRGFIEKRACVVKKGLDFTYSTYAEFYDRFVG